VYKTKAEFVKILSDPTEKLNVSKYICGLNKNTQYKSNDALSIWKACVTAPYADKDSRQGRTISVIKRAELFLESSQNKDSKLILFDGLCRLAITSCEAKLVLEFLRNYKNETGEFWYISTISLVRASLFNLFKKGNIYETPRGSLG